MSRKAKGLGLLLVDQLDGGIVRVTFVENGCRLTGEGETLIKARSSLEGRVAVFRALNEHVIAEMKSRPVAREDLVDFVHRCVRLHLRRFYPMIKLAQVRAEIRAMAKLRGDKLDVAYGDIVTKIHDLAVKYRASG